ncbi:hypothetical protein [Photobacterium damselae]|uniref:hypothetical protein n=1 Tax=Photobacterium damselae TaxID=38293 RepID=UPI001F198A5B|nr:hypothetical protein [Photobacterium damselae]UKA04886.1 hypothetical protein IHC89_21825 [Photobacterium damselae subsp. damselae]
MKTTAKVISLCDFETTEQILSTDHDGLVGDKCMHAAVVFSGYLNKEAKSMDRHLELIRLGFQGVLDELGGMESITELTPDGDIDDGLKAFLRSFALTSTSIANSLSVRQQKMDEFHIFDVIDLLDKVDNMSGMLKRLL